MANIFIFIPSVDRLISENKCFILGKWLQEAGHSPLFLVHTNDCEAALLPTGYPFLRVHTKKMDLNIGQEAKKLLPMLDRPVVDPGDAAFDPDGIDVPTWGDLYVFDDFLGTAQAWNFPGAEAVRPDILITTIPGSETSTAEDSSIHLALYRFAEQNSIPILGLELSSLRNDYVLPQRKVDFLLTKSDPRGLELGHITDVAFPLSPAQRYCFRLGKDVAIEQFLDQEVNLRKQSNVTGKRLLCLPFHLGYKREIIEMLQRMQPYAQQLITMGFELLITTSPATFRRGLTEREIVMQGIIPTWCQQWAGKWTIADGGLTYLFLLMSDVILAPFDSALIELLEGWGAQIIRPGQEQKLEDVYCYETVSRAVNYLEAKKEAK